MNDVSGYKSHPPININDKEAILDEIYVSPLGHLMVKVFFPERKVWTTYNIGKWREIIMPKIKEKN
jgi:hypothetical protein